MYLKRLEIQGFKSFADKLSLEFTKGISGVVGPNGSGKSNISDAVRWALGEQSIRSLRGQKLEDIIFAGTQSRKPLNFAQVTLVLDNADMRLNMEFSEVTVSRRVYRSGESQFLINGAAVRLRDIHELFYDTGIGREGYSIIGQGKIDEILSVKSEDRRALFEEAAGIMKYRVKRHEAEMKLEREGQNLVRIEDILSELSAQLGPLEAQAETAKKFMSLSERLKVVEVNIFLTQVGSAQAEIGKFDENIARVSGSLDNERENRTKNNEMLAALEDELRKSDEDIAELSEQSKEELLFAERTDSSIKLCEQKAGFFRDEIAKLEAGIAGFREAEADGLRRKAEAELGLSLAEKGINEKNEALREAQAAYDAGLSLAKDAEASAEAYGAEHIESLKQLGDTQARIQRAEALYERLEEDMEGISAARNELNEQQRGKTAELDAVKGQIAENAAKFERMNSDLSLYENECAELSCGFSEKKAELSNLLSAQKNGQYRQKLLSGLEQNHEGYYKSVKSVLAQKKTNPAFSGIHGAVGELISVDERYQLAIEIALGGAVQNIVAENEQVVKTAIDYLKRRNEGRATFLPLTTVSGYGQIGKGDRLLAEPGVIGTARELIKYDTSYEKIFGSLLGRVLVIDTMDNAVALSRKYGYKHKAVTLGGELFNPGGAISGGSSASSQSGIISRANELRRLDSDLIKLEAKIAEIAAECDEREAKLSAVTESREKQKFRIRELEMTREGLKNRLAGLESESVRLGQSLEQKLGEERRCMERIAEANTQIRELHENHNALKSSVDDMLRNLEEKRESLKAARDGLFGLQRELTARKVEISAMNEQLSASAAAVSRIDGEIAQLRDSSEKAANDIGSRKLSIEEMHTEEDGLRQELEKSKERAGGYEQREVELYDRKREIRRRIAETRELAGTNAETLSKLGNELSRFELRKEQFEGDIRKIYDEMWDKYGLTYQQALAQTAERLETSPQAQGKEAASLRSEIRALGAVNVSAIEEYRLVNERHGFMKAQRDDIVDAETKLREIINGLTKLMERQFLEKFNAISESFSLVFTEMFHGGKAFLRLEDEGDALECGIEISAQPPGKSLQSMLLLSGGERAMTAIALLFGILRLKPSPFCILDEIEAALDDANVYRFAEYLRNFAGETQFVLITHRKGTMEVADVLYGVTMQEFGVSKLVSVNLQDRVN